MILFENVEKYSNEPFWLIFNLHFPFDFLIIKGSGNKFSFCLVFASFFFFINILMTWAQLTLTFFGFELPDPALDFSVWTENVFWWGSFLLLLISRSFETLWNTFHLKSLWMRLKLMGCCDLKKSERYRVFLDGWIVLRR